MTLLIPTLVVYLLVGMAVGVAFYLSNQENDPSERWFAVATAVPFWPLYLPVLLAGTSGGADSSQKEPDGPPRDEMAAMIRQVDAELEAALSSLDGWAEHVLAHERERIEELRLAWTTQSERIREMDRLLARTAAAETDERAGLGAAPLPSPTSERLRHSLEVRRQNLERLRHVRQRAYGDLMGTLAWVRELVSMIYLAKFTGAPASRAEELVAQIAAAVEGLTEISWPDESPAAVGDNT